MKYKIKYFLTGGENINNSALLYNKKYIGSYDQTNFFEIYQKIEYFSVNPNESLSTKAYFNNINNNNILTTMINGGNLENDRHMVQPLNRSYTNQCMYISIYDYLFLKNMINVNFYNFKKNNKIFTNNNREWDNKYTSHENNIINLCKKYNLDIRIWYKTQNKNLATYIPGGENMTKITTEHNGKYLIAPMIRYGPGNPNIVNIAYIDTPRHFELILGGSFFEPLLTKEQFYALPIEYAKYISNEIHTTYHNNTHFSTSLRNTDEIITNYGQNKNIIKFFNDLFAKDELYMYYFCNHKDEIQNQEQEQEQERQRRKRQKEQERQDQLERLKRERQQQEQQKEQQEQQEQQEQEDDDFFNYENNELIEEFQSWYCDDQNFEGNDIYDYNYYLIHSWQNWRDNYCDSDYDGEGNDWYDKNYEIFSPLTFLDEYHEYYNNN